MTDIVIDVHAYIRIDIVACVDLAAITVSGLIHVAMVCWYEEPCTTAVQSKMIGSCEPA